MKEVVGKKRNVHVASFISLWGSAESTPCLTYDRKALFSLMTLWMGNATYILVGKIPL